MKLSEWNKEDAEQATKEGWCLAEVWGSSYGSPQIQRIDEPEDTEPIFESDEAAWVHVYAWFLAGSKLHAKAFYIMNEENPTEFKIIKKHCESQLTH